MATENVDDQILDELQSRIDEIKVLWAHVKKFLRITTPNEEILPVFNEKQVESYELEKSKLLDFSFSTKRSREKIKNDLLKAACIEDRYSILRANGDVTKHCEKAAHFFSNRLLFHFEPFLKSFKFNDEKDRLLKKMLAQKEQIFPVQRRYFCEKVNFSKHFSIDCSISEVDSSFEYNHHLYFDFCFSAHESIPESVFWLERHGKKVKAARIVLSMSNKYTDVQFVEYAHTKLLIGFYELIRFSVMQQIPSSW